MIKRHILLYKTGYRDNVTLCLNNIYVGSTSYNHLKFCTKHVFYIRNYKNYSNYYYKRMLLLLLFNIYIKKKKITLYRTTSYCAFLNIINHNR